MNLNYVKEVWHTCSLRGSQKCEDIEKDVPFLSQKDFQWLTQGYYFWLDEEHAADWTVIRKFSRGAVSKFHLIFDNEKDIFDLREVKNMNHLSKTIEVVEAAYKAMNRNKPIEDIRTVAHGIALLREIGPDELFRNIAVLSADSGCILKKSKPSFWGSKIPFMRKQSGAMSKEFLSISRLQLCVFELGKNPKHHLLEMKEQGV